MRSTAKTPSWMPWRMGGERDALAGPSRRPEGPSARGDGGDRRGRPCAERVDGAVHLASGSARTPVSLYASTFVLLQTKSPKHTHTLQAPARTALAHRTRTESFFFVSPTHLPKQIRCRGRRVRPITTFCRTCHLPEQIRCRGRSVSPRPTFCRTCHPPKQILCRGRSVRG